MADTELWSPGVFPARYIERLRAAGGIVAPAFDADQVQPASLDLRLGDIAYRVRSSFLPGPEQTVDERIRSLELHRLDLTDGAVLERGCVYLVPLLETLDLPKTVSAGANPKSSTGRLDVFTRVIGDRARGFDTLPAGYSGPLYLEVAPRTFPVRVRRGSRLSQMRFRVGNTRLSVAEHQTLHRVETLVIDANEEVGEGVALSIDLKGGERNGLIGFRSKRHTPVIDMDKKDSLDVLDYWEPLINRGSDEFILDRRGGLALVGLLEGDLEVVAQVRRGRDGAVRSAGRRIPCPLCGLLRPRIRALGGGRHRQPRGTRSALARGAVHAWPRPDDRPADL